MVIASFASVAALCTFACACSTPTPNQQLAQAILNDTSLQQVDSMERAVIKSGFNAGSGYSQIWARDMNTFIEMACEESDPSQLRDAILLFFALQQPNNEMIDEYVLKEDFTWNDDTPYYSDAAPKHVAFKNTVETVQETSLIQIVGKYVEKTGDRSILDEKVAGISVQDRTKLMVDYLLRERYSEPHGLLFGAMTADWGDVQPNDDFGCDMNELSTPAIDVYDNAMFIIALENGGDWTWFGSRMIQQLARNEYTQEAYDEMRPMIDRVIKNNGFYEWYGQGNVPSGSGHFKGSAGTLAKAIEMLNEWAMANKAD